MVMPEVMITENSRKKVARLAVRYDDLL